MPVGIAAARINGVMLAAMLADLPVDIIDLGILPDRLDTLREASLRSSADLLVTTGGASVGDHDLVRPALEAAGGAIDFWRIALRPGKPMMAGRLGDAVGARPARQSGVSLRHRDVVRPPADRASRPARAIRCRAGTVLLGEALPANGARTDYLRAEIRDGRACASTIQDSSMLLTLAALDLPDRPAAAHAPRRKGRRIGGNPAGSLDSKFCVPYCSVVCSKGQPVPDGGNRDAHAQAARAASASSTIASTRRGVSPSFEEMKDALDLKSKSGVHRLISALEERGFIRRLPNRARALEVLRMPERAGDKEAPPKTKASDALAPPRRRQPANDVIEIPLHGRIAAGMPIEALEGDRMLPCPPRLLGAGEHYALEVSGDSMVEAGILDGDYALVRRTETARDGEIVVAADRGRRSDAEVFRREGAHGPPRPRQPRLRSAALPPRQVRVQGKLSGILRRYD